MNQHGLDSSFTKIDVESETTDTTQRSFENCQLRRPFDLGMGLHLRFPII